MRYDELNKTEQKLVDTIENIYTEHPTITETNYIKAITFILNKWKTITKK